MMTATQRAPAAASRGPIMTVGCRADGERFGPEPPDRIARSPQRGAIDGHALEDVARRSTTAPTGAPSPRGGAEEGPDGRGRPEAGVPEVNRHAPDTTPADTSGRRGRGAARPGGGAGGAGGTGRWGRALRSGARR